MSRFLGAARTFTALLLLGACNAPAPGTPEAVADAFADAYFGHADQEHAKQFSALGATKMLEDEAAETRAVRNSSYTPSEANLNVKVVRGQRSSRDERLRFEYTVTFQGGVEKRADIELSRLEGVWKVVRVGVLDERGRDRTQ